MCVFKVVIGPGISLAEGTVVSMHHPAEEEEEDDDEFLSDDAAVGQMKDKTKQKGVYSLTFSPFDTSLQGLSEPVSQFSTQLRLEQKGEATSGRPAV